MADKPSTLMRNEKWARALYEAKPPTLMVAMQMISFYIRYMYGLTPHSGLDGKSPWEVFSQAALPQDRLVDPSELNFMMLAMEKKKIRSEGIRFNKLQYWGIELVDHIGKDVVIRYDYADARWILVYDMKDNFICQAELRQAQHPFIHLDKDNHSSQPAPERTQADSQAAENHRTESEIHGQADSSSGRCLLEASNRHPGAERDFYPASHDRSASAWSRRIHAILGKAGDQEPSSTIGK